MLCIFIAYVSFGTWAPEAHAIWAPTLVVPRDVVLNVAVYVIFGVLAVLSLRSDPNHWLRLVVRVTVIALLYSFANEMLQLYTVDRIASLTDVASAGVGAFAGASLIAPWRAPR